MTDKDTIEQIKEDIKKLSESNPHPSNTDYGYGFSMACYMVLDIINKYIKGA